MSDFMIAPVMSARRVSLLGALYIMMGPVAMTLYLPAMSEIVKDFGTTESIGKMTVTLYFGGFALGQLFWGPLSDALGRRSVARMFAAFFCISSLLALFAPTIGLFLFARAMQGVGAAGGLAVARAVVRDLFEGSESARIMNMISIILAVGPASAPTIGGLVVSFAHWRGISLVLAGLGLAVLMLSVLVQRETVARDLSRLAPRRLARSYGDLISQRAFLVPSLILACSLGTLFAFSTVLPFILMGDLNMTPTAFGLSMLMQSGSYFFASIALRRLMRWFSDDQLLGVGVGLMALACVFLPALLILPASFLTVMGPVAIFAAGTAFIVPFMTTRVLEPFPHVAGSAAALMGFMQMSTGMVVGSVAALMRNPVLSMATLIPAVGITACILFVLFSRIYRPQGR